MSDSRADEILRLHSSLVSDRGVFDGHYRELEDRFSYKGRYFQNETRTQGERSTQRIFDETCILAADRFAAACESMITPRTQRYHSLRPEDDALKSNKKVTDWCQEATDWLFAVRYSSFANFASQSHESYWQTGVYGTGVVFVDDAVGEGIYYRSIHLAESYFAENAYGKVDTFQRKYAPTIRQIAQRFGVDKLPEKYRAMLDKAPETRVDVVHCVMPNQERKTGRLDYQGMPFSSHYVLCEARSILEEGGYRTMPYAVGRYSTSPRETYGRGPGMMALGSIKNLNEMMKTMLRQGQKLVDPPLLLADDALLRQFDLRSGSLNYGGLDDQGNQLVMPLQMNGRLDAGEFFVNRATKIVNDAFLVTLFEILVEAPNMTATEAMLRSQQRGQLLAPTMGRLQSEQLGAIIERELDIGFRAGALPEMPKELIEAGGAYAVTFDAPLNRLQKSEDAVGVLKTLEALAPLAQNDPSVMDIMNVEEAARVIAEVNGAPSKVLRSKEQMEAMKEGRQQQSEMQAMLQAAPVAASAAKDMATAQQIARQSPGVLPGIGA